MVGDKIIVSSRLFDERGWPRRETYRVLAINDGHIIDWQDCRTRRKAGRYARGR